MNHQKALRDRLRIRRRIAALACALLLITAVLTSLPHARVQAGSGYTVIWSTIATAVTKAAGPYQLNATVGQPAAGTQSGGRYELGSGFWGGGTPPDSPPSRSEALYLPLLTRP